MQPHSIDDNHPKLYLYLFFQKFRSTSSWFNFTFNIVDKRHRLDFDFQLFSFFYAYFVSFQLFVENLLILPFGQSIDWSEFKKIEFNFMFFFFVRLSAQRSRLTLFLLQMHHSTNIECFVDCVIWLNEDCIQPVIRCVELKRENVFVECQTDRVCHYIRSLVWLYVEKSMSHLNRNQPYFDVYQWCDQSRLNSSWIRIEDKLNGVERKMLSLLKWNEKKGGKWDITIWKILPDNFS